MLEETDHYARNETTTPSPEAPQMTKTPRNDEPIAEINQESLELQFDLMTLARKIAWYEGLRRTMDQRQSARPTSVNASAGATVDA
jgi:hypothetical protein